MNALWISLKRGLGPAALASVLLAAAASAEAAWIDNGLPSTQTGYWAVDVLDGGESRGAEVTPANPGGIPSDVVFDYFSYADTGSGVFRLGTGSPPIVIGPPHQVESSGNFVGSSGGMVDWTAVSTIPPGSPMMLNLYTFSAAPPFKLGKLRFSQYLDADVPASIGGDYFIPRGSAAGPVPDRELYTIDINDDYGASQGGSLAVSQGLVNSSFAGWAACKYPQLKSGIAAGTQNVSPQGVVCPDLAALAFNDPILGRSYGPADISSALTWDVSPNATSATIVTTLSGVPDSSLSLPPSSRLNLKQANFLSYFAADTKYDGLTLSGYLPNLDPSAQGPESYCSKDLQIEINVWLYANGQWIQANAPGSLTAQMPKPSTTPYAKCRFLSRDAGIKDLAFEVIQLRLEKYVYMTLQVNNRFDWDPAVDGSLPTPPPQGTIYPMLIQVQVGSGPLTFFGTTTLKVCDYNSSKVKLCAGPFQY
jgi:hypothetical protein